jgi:cytochrome c556
MTSFSRACAAGTTAVALAIAWGAAGTRVAAQPTRPIYLQYDGFVRNTDGSITLSFGYFNMNSVDVNVSAGADNTFTPGTGDRNQPTRFLKGRHRFVCSMVVDKAFDGKLRWTLTFAGHSETTTAQPLDPLYELEANNAKRAVAGLDVATAPKNVCLNRGPSLGIVSPLDEVNTGAAGPPTVATRLDQDAVINGQVEDDGLPRGSAVTTTWKKVSGPGTVTFSDPAAGPTHAKFSAPGAYVLDLSATDGEKSSSLKVDVTVAALGEAPTDAYKTTMKSIGAGQAELRTHTTAKDYDKIAADAAALKKLFETTGAFWQPRNAADAMGFVSTGSKATDDLAAAAKAKSDDGITSASRALGGTCAGCHGVHRERQPDGTFLIK